MVSFAFSELKIFLGAIEKASIDRKFSRNEGKRMISFWAALTGKRGSIKPLEFFGSILTCWKHNSIAIQEMRIANNNLPVLLRQRTRRPSILSVIYLGNLASKYSAYTTLPPLAALNLLWLYVLASSLSVAVISCGWFFSKLSASSTLIYSEMAYHKIHVQLAVQQILCLLAEGFLFTLLLR